MRSSGLAHPRPVLPATHLRPTPRIATVHRRVARADFQHHVVQENPRAPATSIVVEVEIKIKTLTGQLSHIDHDRLPATIVAARTLDDADRVATGRERDHIQTVLVEA